MKFLVRKLRFWHHFVLFCTLGFNSLILNKYLSGECFRFGRFKATFCDEELLILLCLITAQTFWVLYFVLRKIIKK